MPWWVLLLFVLFVWCLWAVAAAAQTGVEYKRRPLPDGQRPGVSIAPAIPVFPLVFWCAAKLIDLIANPWGTTVIAVLHAAFAVVLVLSIVRDCVRLRS
jgi:hypothetical protein